MPGCEQMNFICNNNIFLELCYTKNNKKIIGKVYLYELTFYWPCCW